MQKLKIIKRLLFKMLVLLLVIITLVPSLIPQLIFTVEAKEPTYPYVAKLGENKNVRDESYKEVGKLKKGAIVTVLGKSKNYSHRLVVVYGSLVGHVTPELVNGKGYENYKVAILPENKNLRENNDKYITKILKGSIVIVKGNYKKASGRKEVLFGDLKGDIGSNGIDNSIMTSKKAKEIVKSYKTTIGGTNGDEKKNEKTESLKFPYVAVLKDDKNARDEKYNLVTTISKNEKVTVLGYSKNYPKRLMVAYGKKVGHVTADKVEKVENNYAAILPGDKHLRDNNYNYKTTILDDSIVIVEGDSKKYSGRKEIVFGNLEGSIGSNGIVAMTEAEATNIVKAGKTNVGGTKNVEQKEEKKEEVTSGKKEKAVNRYKRTFYNSNFDEIGSVPANVLVETTGKTVKKWGNNYIQVTYNGKTGYILNTYVDQLSEKIKMIIVDISEQKVYMYENGKLYDKSDCVTGTKGKADTPLGTYSIQYRERRTRMTREDEYDVTVEYNMPFYGHYCLHASTRKTFGGNVYKTNGSHGCVNLPKAFAKKMYNWVEYEDDGDNEPRTPVYIVK